MPQPARHEPELQTLPLAQLEPFEIEVQLVVAVPGWQLWHALFGLGVPLAYRVLPIQHMA